MTHSQCNSKVTVYVSVHLPRSVILYEWYRLMVIKYLNNTDTFIAYGKREPQMVTALTWYITVN